jgi:hypothetical protein
MVLDHGIGPNVIETKITHTQELMTVVKRIDKLGFSDDDGNGGTCRPLNEIFSVTPYYLALATGAKRPLDLNSKKAMLNPPAPQ